MSNKGVFTSYEIFINVLEENTLSFATPNTYEVSVGFQNFKSERECCSENTVFYTET